METHAHRWGASRRLIPLTLIWVAALIASGWRPHDRATWWMEVAPVLIVLPILWAWRRRFPWTGLALTLVAIHGLILMLGGAYSYARVPAGFWVQDWLHLARNPYDRLGHFAQGFVPAILFREALIRRVAGARGAVLVLLVLACCLALSAAYELIEFGAAVALGQGANEFLGTQGDPWDTQWDMLTCLIGAVAALLTLSWVHDRQIGSAKIGPDRKAMA